MFEDLAPVWAAFLQLSSTRAEGFGASPIAMTDFAAWFDLHAVTGASERARWFRFLRALDERWLRFHRETETERKAKRDAEAGTDP